MRIVIFGASSRAGLYIVKEALEKDHRVAAFTKRPEAYPLGHPKLETIGGDITDPASVAQALHGARGVICALEASRREAAPAAHPTGAENIILGMETAGCRRSVWLTAAGSQKGGPSAGEEVLVRLRASGLDWVWVSAARYREGWGRGQVEVHFDGPAGRYVYLADLAAFLVEELERGRYFRRAIAVFSA